MNKKAIITRSIAFAICFAIVIVAMVFSVDSNTGYAGAGDGENASINTAEEFSDMISQVFLDNRTSIVSLAETTEGSTGTKTYRSGTFHETSRVSWGADYAMNSVTSHFKARMDREMDCYLTEDAAYYVADVVLSSYSSASGPNDSGEIETETQRTDMNMRIHVWFGSDFIMFRFDRFNSISNGEYNERVSRAIGKWVLASKEDDLSVFSALASVNNQNFETMEVIGEVLQDTDKFTKKGKIYNLKEQAFGSLVDSIMGIIGAGSYYSGDELSGGLQAMLDEPTKPSFNIKIDYDHSMDLNSGSGSGSARTMKSYASEVDDFTFSNINNTVLRTPDPSGAMTVEEFNSYWEDEEE